MTETLSTETNTSGGTYIEGSVTAGQQFIGRDNVTFNIIAADPKDIAQALLSVPLTNRREHWQNEIGESVAKLHGLTGISLEQLQTNDTFIDTVLQATQIALRNSQKEKLDALKNAMINAALPHPPEKSLQQMFLNFIDTFTVWHLRILKLFSDPKRWAVQNNHKFPNLSMGGLSDILESAYPELCSKQSFYDQVWQDLSQRGLINTNSLHVTMTGNGLMEKRTSDVGNQFLRFIEESQ